MGRQALRTALRRHGRKALQPKAFTPRTTDSTHGKRCAPNLLLDQPHPPQANRVWVSDITYLPLASDQWIYCCAFQDICTKQVVYGPTCPRRWLLPPYSRHCSRNGLLQAYLSTPTGVASTLATGTKPCFVTLRPTSRTVAAASATTTLKPKACGRASKPNYSKHATCPFSRIWPMRKRASPRILITTITSAATPDIGYLKPYLFHQQQLANVT